MSKRSVAYYYDPEGSSYFFSPCHPMEPTRVNMTHELGIDKATDSTLKTIHDGEYIDSLKHTKPELTAYNSKNHKNTEDCPLFPGVYDYTSSSVGGSICAAKYLNSGKADICIHWAGGMHHAKKGGASGFCYGNDIAAGILELLKVLYIDIDVHHGDGVEHMFYHTNRVMTLSFHQAGDFFPGTGQIEDRGVGTGKNYALNVPFKRGIDDLTYLSMFQPIVAKTIERYQPEAIVMQMGADSVVGDRLGQFNLSNVGHASCLKYVMSFHLPLIVLGGGGYTAYNVARTWALETGVILNEPLSDELPNNSYLGLPEGRGSLYIPAIESMENLNTKSYLDSVYERVMYNLSQSEIAPAIRAEVLISDEEHSSDDDDDESEEEEDHTSLQEGFSPTSSQDEDINTVTSETSRTYTKLTSHSPMTTTMTREEESELEALNAQMEPTSDNKQLNQTIVKDNEFDTNPTEFNAQRVPKIKLPSDEVELNNSKRNRSHRTSSNNNSEPENKEGVESKDRTPSETEN